MNFQRRRGREEPEINLIPMIDVLLVILIFLMITTTYSKFSGLEINLPTSDTPPQQEQPSEIKVMVAVSGDVLVNGVTIGGHDPVVIGQALRRAAGEGKDPLVVINADAKATHQSVVDVMQGAQQAGLPKISFATQSVQK